MLAAESTGTPGAALTEWVPSVIEAADLRKEAALSAGLQVPRRGFSIRLRPEARSPSQMGSQADGREGAGEGFAGPVDTLLQP
jgi:hypothetical protein